MGETTAVIEMSFQTEESPSREGMQLSRALGAGMLALLLGSSASAAALHQDPPPAETPVDEKAAAEEAKPAEPEFTPPPRRRAIDGIGSVTSVSTLTFPSQPDLVYQLDATYVFPQRARWRMAPYVKPEKAKPGKTKVETTQQRQSRRLQYRCGDGVWTTPLGKTASEAYEGDEKRKTLLQFELRRLALIWPGELEWTGEGQTRRAELPDLGVLEAQLDETSGRPTSLSSSAPDGSAGETLSKIEWSTPEEGQRTWPVSWQLELDGQLIWKETFVKVIGGLKYNEAFFLPFDRRVRKGARSGVAADNIQHIQVPEVAVWRQDLSKEARTDWDLALKEAREALAGWTPVFEGSRLTLDPRPCFLLNQEAQPTRIELHLTNMPADPPTGWFAQGGFKAVRAIMTGLDSLDAASLRRLQARVPEGHQPGGPWVVVQLTESGVGLTQVIFPALK